MSQPQGSGQIVGMEPVPTVPPGAVVAGKYQIVRLIGQGGMGSVYAAVHLGLGHQVAIKLISQSHARSVDARRRFDTEAKAAARLRSRHVVQVFDNGVAADGTPYLVMELLEGESLDRRIERLGRLSLEDTVRIASEAARALARAHAMGVIHRDLKPENVYLAREDDIEVAKVLDFGIAKLRDADPQASGTRTGAVLGTPLFMSPEQARGIKGVDHRADVYSLGMVIYTMLTGTAAIAGESLTDILVAICTKPLPSLEASASLPPGFDAWFSRACAREPADRYPTVESMIEGFCALARATAGVNFRAHETHGSVMDAARAASQGGPGVRSMEIPASPRAMGIPAGPQPAEEAYVVPKRSMAPLLVAIAGIMVVVGISAVVLLRTLLKAPADEPSETGEVASSGVGTGADSAGKPSVGVPWGEPPAALQTADARGVMVQPAALSVSAYPPPSPGPPILKGAPPNPTAPVGKPMMPPAAMPVPAAPPAGKPAPVAPPAGKPASAAPPAGKPAPAAPPAGKPAPAAPPAAKPASTAVDLGI